MSTTASPKPITPWLVLVLLSLLFLVILHSGRLNLRHDSAIKIPPIFL